MKREEAKSILEVMAIELTGELANSERPVTERTKLLGKQLKAIDMAIEALSKPIVDITQRDLCADISCTDCPFMQETCKLMDYVAYADRPKGEWLDTGDPLMRTCSNCGYGVLIQNVNNFCPNCGADMRKETE